MWRYAICLENAQNEGPLWGFEVNCQKPQKGPSFRAPMISGPRKHSWEDPWGAHMGRIRFYVRLEREESRANVEISRKPMIVVTRIEKNDP